MIKGAFIFAAGASFGLTIAAGFIVLLVLDPELGNKMIYGNENDKNRETGTTPGYIK